MRDCSTRPSNLWPSPLQRGMGAQMLKEFCEFAMKGNVVDLAVGVVIGAAFGAIVTALVGDFLTPLIGAIVGKQSFANLSFKVNNADFLYGDFINKLLSFLLIAAAVFFLVVKP